MESEVYTNATFTGNIIEEVDLFSPGEMTVRAKGKFTIHGIEKVQMIDVVLTISENNILIESIFEIQLKDYKIAIPRIVNKKIAETIKITVNATLQKK
jgi:polyisoprenoid-binding protein YceI